MRLVPEDLLNLPAMNILIENAESLEYLAGNGGWTKNVAKGKNFEATGVAFKIAKQELVGKFNIVAYIAESKQFINLDHGRGKSSAETGEVTAEAVPVSQA
jgi:hypothetical protein